MNMIDYDLLSIQEARILAENAAETQKKLSAFTQEALDHIVERVAAEAGRYAQELAALSVEETGCGRWEDKLVKNRFACENVSRALRDVRCVGVIRRDALGRAVEIGVPRGTIAAFCPVTSPVSTAIYKALLAIKSGNCIIFSPHPKAKRAMTRVLDIIVEAAEKAGLPAGAVSYPRTACASGARALMMHGAVSQILMTGVPALLDTAMKTGKLVLYGGAGNGPAFIERTADLHQAVRDIIQSKTFDYGMAAAAEQSVVADRSVSEAVKREFQKEGAYFMTGEEAERLGTIIFQKDGTLNREFIGKPAERLAKAAGFAVPQGTVLLISEQKYVSEKNPYTRQNLCPVLAYYVEDNWQHACEKCIELLLSERRGHTLVIHSRDEAVIEQFALKKPVARMLVNTPGVFGGMGMTTDLFPAMTLGSGTVGLGTVTGNVGPRNLVYIRKVGYGMGTPERSPGLKPPDRRSGEVAAGKYSETDLALFRSWLKELLWAAERRGPGGT